MSRPRSRDVWRALDGILLLDKPGGMSSNAALQQARKLFAAEKGGHTGSLDPLATGVLPLCFGETTKIAGLLLSGRKAYETVARFGVETDTGDADGVAIARHAMAALDPARVRDALLPFVGRITQIPPVYSAIKQGGEALYVKARRGETVEVPSREVEIYAIDVVECGADWVRLQVECGSGTYIRSLVRDLGTSLGGGAHVETLRRLWVEPFVTPRLHTIEDLTRIAAEGGHAALDRLLLPVEAGLTHLPRVQLDTDQLMRIGQGQSLPWPQDGSGEHLALNARGRAAGFVRLEDGLLKPQRLFRWAAVGSTDFGTDPA